MPRFDILLWDVDGTLLDFIAAEKAAVQTLFREFGLGECTDEMVERYSRINKEYWERLERGELSKPEILVRRFADFFASEGLDASKAPEFNEQYQVRLGDTVVFCDDSYELLSSLRGRVKQYAVSNGTVVAQTRKLRRSGFDRLLDGVFLSEELGYEKPATEFFDRVFAAIGEPDRERVLIVGDSLTSDITGGNRAGIRTCWYNPKGEPNLTAAHADYEIRDLHGILDII
ncbi:MAG TPA: noncanonical pyrimidine nucleotidase, YjjG family [Candidatus Scatomorpha pullicola]|nr:noncanonical pyrimidine nucleotidase, YjjG family [Candidatus Scatomorpha pullicola]